MNSSSHGNSITLVHTMKTMLAIATMVTLAIVNEPAIVFAVVVLVLLLLRLQVLAAKMELGQVKNHGAIHSDDIANRSKLQMFLQALLGVLSGRWQLPLCIDVNTQLIAGIGVSGQNPLVLEVHEGVVHSGPLLAWATRPESPPLLIEIVSTLRNGNVALMDFVSTVFSVTESTKSSWWLVRQLIWAIGLEADMAVAALHEEVEPLRGSGEVEVARQPILGGGHRQATQELRAYLLSTLALYRGSRFLSIAPDGGKVGKRSFLIGAMMNGENGIASWCAPQVEACVNVVFLILLVFELRVNSGAILVKRRGRKLKAHTLHLVKSRDPNDCFSTLFDNTVTN